MPWPGRRISRPRPRQRFQGLVTDISIDSLLPFHRLLAAALAQTNHERRRPSVAGARGRPGHSTPTVSKVTGHLLADRGRAGSAGENRQQFRG